VNKIFTINGVTREFDFDDMSYYVNGQFSYIVKYNDIWYVARPDGYLSSPTVLKEVIEKKPKERYKYRGIKALQTTANLAYQEYLFYKAVEEVLGE
jgi:hypothetical protein